MESDSCHNSYLSGGGVGSCFIWLPMAGCAVTTTRRAKWLVLTHQKRERLGWPTGVEVS